MADGKSDTFWGNLLGGVAAVASVPVGLAKGAYNAANGDSFEKGFEDVVETTFETVKEFGDEHAGPITGGVTSAVAMTVLTIVTGGRHKG